ncbi:MAG: coproporphyrinogen III oxidase, partial [Pseudomonadota bacterium]
ANPDDRARFFDLHAAGFNRLSLGVQSLRDTELQFLGRNHNAEQALLAVEAATDIFEKVSLDFIYALPDQHLDQWLHDLGRIAHMGAGHLSLYQLTIEPQTAFGKAAERGTLIPMPDDRAADFYEATQETMCTLGFPAYEVSNHAQPGQEARHNALYWEEADWIGVGPSAAGRLGPADARLATVGAQHTVGYPDLAKDERIIVQNLTHQEHLIETIAGGLRPMSGLSLSRLGSAQTAVCGAAEPLIDQGFLKLEQERLRATARGRLVLDHLAANLAAALPDETSPLA